MDPKWKARGYTCLCDRQALEGTSLFPKWPLTLCSVHEGTPSFVIFCSLSLSLLFLLCTLPQKQNNKFLPFLWKQPPVFVLGSDTLKV